MKPDTLEALAHALERFDFLGHMSLGGDQYHAWQSRKMTLAHRAHRLGDDGRLLYQTCIDAAGERLPGKAW